MDNLKSRPIIFIDITIAIFSLIILIKEVFIGKKMAYEEKIISVFTVVFYVCNIIFKIFWRMI